MRDYDSPYRRSTMSRLARQAALRLRWSLPISSCSPVASGPQDLLANTPELRPSNPTSIPEPQELPSFSSAVRGLSSLLHGSTMDTWC